MDASSESPEQLPIWLAPKESIPSMWPKPFSIVAWIDVWNFEEGCDHSRESFYLVVFCRCDDGPRGHYAARRHARSHASTGFGLGIEIDGTRDDDCGRRPPRRLCRAHSRSYQEVVIAWGR